ncbi:hypothetical protein EUTSA_v10029436mg, partial [Eutrema salsugineum]
MVAFGKKLKERSIEEWQEYYINYKLMKKKVKQYGRQIEVGSLDRRHLLKDFSRMLDHQKISRVRIKLLLKPVFGCMQIEKITLFMLEQQGLLSSRLQKLRECHDALQDEPDISQIHNLREAYRSVGQDLLKLLFFIDMNAIGIRKILKKFDKRFGYRFTNYYVKTRADHPYSQLQQVFRHVGLGAVVGAISRNLHELQNNQGSYLSIYDQPVLPLQDPVVDSIKNAVDRLTHSTNFLNFMAQHALIMQDEDLLIPQDEEADQEEGKYHFMSLLLNLANTFLYMVNTYIIVPTADDYSMSLGAAATVCGVVIGAMAVAQLFSSVYFSAWSNKSYFKPLIFSSIVLFFGNLLYALAYDSNSLALLLIGRLFCGALGMACGPALGGLLQTNFKIYNLTINQDTVPGWVMTIAWLVYLVWLAILFREPAREPEETEQDGDADQDGNMEKALQNPLLLASEETEQDDEDDGDGSEESAEDSRKPANSIVAAYKLLTPSVKKVVAFGKKLKERSIKEWQ